MKKILMVLILCITTVSIFAQNTIKFLDIPVDGTKQEVIIKLQTKGYEYNTDLDILTGVFNGYDVIITIQDVNNRVYRIVVMDRKATDEINIKIKYNLLFDQFINSGKYVSIDNSTKLTDNDDINYEIHINKKRYISSFRLIDETINGEVRYMILKGNYSSKYRICIVYENFDNSTNNF